MKTLAISLAAVAATLVPVAASADSNRVQVSRQVAYKDLDLTSDAGQQSLDHRLAGAVRNVCGSSGGRDLVQAMQYRRCRDEARTTASVGRQIAMASGSRRTGVALATTPEIGK